MRKRHARVTTLAAVLAGLLVWAWFRGLVADALVLGIARWCLPVRLGGEGEVTAVARRSVSLVPESGALLAVSPARLRAIVGEALGGTWFIPPGLIRDGLLIEGRWFREGGERAIPVAIACTPAVGEHPRFVFRYPGRTFHAMLGDDAAYTTAREKEYLLGHYDLVQSLTFRTAEITSRAPDGMPRFGERVVDVSAVGRARFQVIDGWASARATAAVKRLRGRLFVRPVVHGDGIGIDYEVKIDEMTADVNNVAPWADRKLSESLRESCERSMNKPRKRERMARRRLPAWFPFDMEVDIRLTDEDPPPRAASDASRQDER